VLGAGRSTPHKLPPPTLFPATAKAVELTILPTVAAV
jgi:hypothetical protein